MDPINEKPQIWVDADACPVASKEILFKAANRTQTRLTLIANQNISVPKSEFIHNIVVPTGFDAADKKIVEQVQSGDLVITSDIPLADEALSKGADVLSPRGEWFTTENIKARLNLRDFFDTLRSSGIQTAGPQKLKQSDRKSFADALDRWLANSE